jgi:hypothetical protein
MHFIRVYHKHRIATSTHPSSVIHDLHSSITHHPTEHHQASQSNSLPTRSPTCSVISSSISEFNIPFHPLQLGIVRSNAPILDRNIWWSKEIASGHTVPLRVQEDLQRKVTSLVGGNDQNGNTRVRRVLGVLASRDRWILGHGIGSHCTE